MTTNTQQLMTNARRHLVESSSVAGNVPLPFNSLQSPKRAKFPHNIWGWICDGTQKTKLGLFWIKNSTSVEVKPYFGITLSLPSVSELDPNLLYTCHSSGMIQPKAGQQNNSTDFTGAWVDSEVI